MKKLYVSIGALQAFQVVDKLECGFRIVAYEPEKQAFQKYQEIENPDFTCYNKAVSNFEGMTFLCSDGGNSTILKREDFSGKSYLVEVVTLDSILKQFEEVDVLHINCEGSEVPILISTSLDNLKRCKAIFVEFHRFCRKLHITNKMITACLRRLQSEFEVVNLGTYHPYYEFFRRDRKERKKRKWHSDQ